MRPTVHLRYTEGSEILASVYDDENVAKVADDVMIRVRQQGHRAQRLSMTRQLDGWVVAAEYQVRVGDTVWRHKFMRACEPWSREPIEDVTP